MEHLLSIMHSGWGQWLQQKLWQQQLTFREQLLWSRLCSRCYMCINEVTCLEVTYSLHLPYEKAYWNLLSLTSKLIAKRENGCSLNSSSFIPIPHFSCPIGQIISLVCLIPILIFNSPGQQKGLSLMISVETTLAQLSQSRSVFQLCFPFRQDSCLRLEHSISSAYS